MSKNICASKSFHAILNTNKKLKLKIIWDWRKICLDSGFIIKAWEIYFDWIYVKKNQFEQSEYNWYRFGHKNAIHSWQKYVKKYHRNQAKRSKLMKNVLNWLYFHKPDIWLLLKNNKSSLNCLFHLQKKK